MFTRPKPGESEDEILARQNKFLLEKQENKNFQPAAKLVGSRKHEGPEIPHTNSKQPRLTVSGKVNAPEGESSNEKCVMDDNVYFPQPLPCILGDIIEKNTKNISEPSFSFSSHTPKAGRSKSIFSQRLKEKKDKNAYTTNSPLPEAATSTNFIDDNLPKSTVLRKEDAEEIHQKNQLLLDSMTNEEILKEREEIMNKLDPKILKFLQTRSNKNLQNVETKIEEMQDNHMIQDVKPIFNDLLDNEIISHPELNKWVHFDKMEEDKLEWIKSIEPLPTPLDDAPYEARFDFKGYLLPYTMEYNEETKVLFHHGEESHRPGYTLNELFQLCRSTVIQQRSLALNTIAGILDYQSIGIYNGIISIPLTKIFFVLRYAIDENMQSILEPSLKGLRNMLYNKVDETCLDNCLGYENGLFQPRILSNKMETDETETDISELKDFHLADIDLISGAIRTDILARIRYILFVIKPSYLCTEYCLQILTRISRDSLGNVQTLLQVDGLIENIFKKYIPQLIPQNFFLQNNSEFHKVILNALKLLRVIVSQSKSFADVFESRFSIVDCLLNYVNLTADTTYLLKIQTEVYNILSIFTKYDVNSFKLKSVILLLLKSVDYHVNNINMTGSCSNYIFNHSTSLLMLFSNILTLQNSGSHIISVDLIKQFGNLLVYGGSKWCSQTSNIEVFLSVRWNLMSGVFTCLNTLHKLGYESYLPEISKLNNCIHNMIMSSSFSKITDFLLKCSNILATYNIESNHEESSNIPSLEAINLNCSHKLQPILGDTSPFNFISSICKYLVIHQNTDLSYYFFTIDGIIKYLTEFQSSKINHLSSNWFTRTELELIFNLITLCHKLKCSEMQKLIVYNASFKLSYTLPKQYKTELKFLFKNIIFNKAWFTTDRLLKNLNLSESNDILNNLHSIMECYYHSFNLSFIENCLCFIITDWNQTILPRDWIYMPILGLYTKNNGTGSVLSEKDFMKKDIICCCLKWIFISESFFPDITNEISLTDRFCRILCVFLCDNSLFLDAKVKSLLQKCVQIIFNLEKTLPPSKKFDFDKPLLGIANFQDLYMQLVNQYQAESYGDPLFASCVMVPLSHKHNIKWRKIVWSEYADCLLSLDCPENMLCYALDEYLSPSETDLSLLKNYHHALKSQILRTGTITYKIAHHHIEAVKMRTK